MNSDRNTGGMTVNALMQVGLILSAVIPVVVIAGFGVYVTQRLSSGSNFDQTTFILLLLACAIVVLIGVFVVNYLVQRRIKDRILNVVDVCRDYMGGDRSARAAVNGNDEFAVLAGSINSLLDGQPSAASNTSFSGSGTDAAALQAQIEKLLQEVSAVGDGDLRVQAEVTPDTLGVLADSFNYMIEELSKVVGRVQTTAVQVTNATRRILDRSAELAHASETQVTQISQTTAAVEALAVFIQNVARNAQLSVEAAQDALRNASTGQQAVRQTINGMILIRENVQETSKKIKRLGERSNEIGEIIRIIEDIADQTNLLALNAAIQSAMAGEHGRGFAVVADEIRLLAERSTESTKRIATLIKSIQGDTYEAVVAMEDSTQEVVKGSQLADEAGRALNSIYGAVERQAQMIDSIARAANEQATISEEVAVAMSQISEITRQTNSGTQEGAASVSYLAELADQLRASVSTFRLPERGNEMVGAGAFGMTSITEVANSGGNQFMGGNSEADWSRNFGPNFPPLPEPGQGNQFPGLPSGEPWRSGQSLGSVVALTSRTGQYNFNNQQDFAPFGGQQDFGDQTFGGQQPFGNQPTFGGQQSPFGGQPQFGGQQPFGNPASFGGQSGFDDFSNGDNQQGFNGQPGFGNMPTFASQGGQNTFPPVGQMPGSGTGPAAQNPGMQTPPMSQPRPRWQTQSPQQNQGQSPFNQDQMPFPNSGGQFGQ